MRNMKIITILGQTSTGKSDFAVEIAKQINGEIISADSRQVYKGMNLGTGKITKKEMLSIPHHLLNVYPPSKIFSVNDFKILANKKIEEINARRKIPIICGGTGFYIDAIINETIFPDVPPNKKLRKILQKETAEKLFEILKKLDSARAKNIDSKNTVRLIRAIEIAKSLGKVPLLRQGLKSEFEVLKIGLAIPPETLKNMIQDRLIKRIKKGMVKEVEKLHKSGISWKRMRSLGLEYRYVSLYLENKLTKEEMIEKLNTEIWHFAKRQKTWFKRDSKIIWINPLKNSDRNMAKREIKKFLK